MGGGKDASEGSKMLAMTFAEKVSKLLDQKRWPQQRLREVLSAPVGQATAHGWVTGKGPLPRADQALEIAKALEVDLVWLLDEKQEFPPVPWSSGDNGLTEDEKLALRLVRTMGTEQAIRRLAALEVRPLSVEQADKLKRELGR